VALALAAELKTAVIMASDRSRAAIGVARQNARRHGLDQRVHFFCGKWFDCLQRRGRFDMILSNPPYIPTAEIDRLQAEVSGFEPRGALDGGADGLDAVRVIIDGAGGHLTPGGHLLLEIGHDQRPAVEAIAGAAADYDGVEFGRDYSGHDRVAILRRK
jgi:release factor glutamine methyltransferase